MSNENQGQMIAQYRKAKNWSQEDLASALRVDTRTVQRMEKQNMIKSIERRRLLVGLLGIPALLLGLEQEQKKAQAGTIAINTDRMSFFEEEMTTRWDMYHTGGTIRAARGLEMWLSEMARFARSASDSVWHERALALLAMSYQLHSCVSRDLMNYDQAHTSFQKAYQVAKELDDAEMMGAALAREGITLIQEDKAEKAVRYFQGALEVTKNLGLTSLRGFTLQGLSEAYARNQQQQECWSSINLAERMLERQGQEQERSLARINLASITAQKGVDAVLLHDNDRAVTLIDKSLLQYDPTRIRGRARLLAQKAEAYLGLGFIDFCVNTAEESLTLANSVGSTKTTERVKRLYSMLLASSWRKEPSTARLGALLTLMPS